MLFNCIEELFIEFGRKSLDLDSVGEKRGEFLDGVCGWVETLLVLRKTSGIGSPIKTTSSKEKILTD